VRDRQGDLLELSEYVYVCVCVCVFLCVRAYSTKRDRVISWIVIIYMCTHMYLSLYIESICIWYTVYLCVCVRAFVCICVYVCVCTEVETDPIIPLATQLRKESYLLCFDEFQVTDIANAMLIKSLFERLFQYGVVVVRMCAWCTYLCMYHQ